MVESRKKGKGGKKGPSNEDFDYNKINENEYNGGGGGDDFVGGGKQHRSGVGGKASASHNFKECKNANKRRNEKIQRANVKAEEEEK